MNSLIIYILKVSAGIGIIALPYYFLLRNDPNLVLKRLYLILGLMAAWISPLLVFQKPEALVNLTPVVFMDLDTAEALPLASVMQESHAGITINWVKILLLVYSAGLAFLLIKNLAIIIKHNLDWNRNHDESGIAFTRSEQVFTLFTRIFVPHSLRDKTDLENILLHERAHVQQMHYIDLILVELTLLLTWFNPFSWLISRMIKENHEHLADRQVLAGGVNPVLYRAQLLNHTLGVNVFRMGNQFNHSLTLKRFKMMKKPTRSYPGIAKIAFLVPVILISMGVLTGMTAQQTRIVNGKVVFAEDGSPAAGASVVVKGGTTGTVVDRDGSFSLEVKGDPELVISFVGYGNLVKKASKAGKRTLKLVEKDFSLNLDNVIVSKQHGNEESDKKSETESAVVPEGEEMFYIVEDMPVFPGGISALKTHIYSNLVYPEQEKSRKITGEVKVRFKVDTDGQLQNIEIAQSTYQGFDEAAIEVFRNMPAWNPGKQRGKPVAVNVVVPVKFGATEN